RSRARRGRPTGSGRHRTNGSTAPRAARSTRPRRRLRQLSGYACAQCRTGDHDVGTHAHTSGHTLHVRHADRPTVEEYIDVAAAPVHIWPLVSDITLP